MGLRMSGELTWWVAPDGVQTQLDVDWSASGRFMPAISHQELAVPGQPGSFVYQSLHQPHEFTLPMWFYGTSDIDLRNQIRSVMYQMSPDRGTGSVLIQAPDGVRRQIFCRVSDGLGLDESTGSSGVTTQKAAVLFRAFDPYWYDVSPISDNWGITLVPTFFPIFPLRLTSSEVVVSQVVANLGDVPTWPVWTITGPGSGIQLQNITTGQTISFSTLTLGSGQSLTIDTRPGVKTVTMQDGTNMFWDLSATSALWALAVGNNSFNLQMSAAIAGQSTVSVSHWQRYLSP